MDHRQPATLLFTFARTTLREKTVFRGRNRPRIVDRNAVPILWEIETRRYLLNIRLPYSMQLIAQFYLSRPSSNEVFHNTQFIVTPSFKTTGVVKYEAWVALENHFILDIVNSSLRQYKLATRR